MVDITAPKIGINASEFVKPTKEEWEAALASIEMSIEEAKDHLGVPKLSAYNGTLDEAIQYLVNVPVGPQNFDDITATPSDRKDDLKKQIRRQYTEMVKGKPYLKAMGRVLLMRLSHSVWSLETENILLIADEAVFKATLSDENGHIISNGHGRATSAGTKNIGGRYIEMAETAAIARCLSLAGFGTDDSLDDSEYLSDSPISKN